MIALWIFLTVLCLSLMLVMGLVTAVVGILRWIYQVPRLPRTPEEVDYYSYNQGVPPLIADCMKRGVHAHYEDEGHSSEDEE